MERNEYERDMEVILDWESWKKGKRMWIYELWKPESKCFCKYSAAFLYYYLISFYFISCTAIACDMCWSRDKVQSMGFSS